MKHIANTQKHITKYYREKGLRGHKRLVSRLEQEPQRAIWPEALLVAHALRCREHETNARHVWDIEYLALTTPWEEWFWAALELEDTETARVCLDHCGVEHHSHARVAVGRLFG